jgi:hypothetical protein
VIAGANLRRLVRARGSTRGSIGSAEAQAISCDDSNNFYGVTRRRK